MPDCSFVTKELANWLGVLAHPERVQIVLELHDAEMDVNSLQNVLGVAHARVSQNLSVLRSHRIVAERRQGRHVFYRLIQPEIAPWLLEGLSFLDRGAALNDEFRGALTEARALWSRHCGTTKEPAS